MRIGLTPDELVATTWQAPRHAAYAARVPGLDVLAGETLALTGTGTTALLDRLAAALDACARVDGAIAARGGTLRIHAQQAARVGVAALAISEPFATLPGPAAGLAVADLAGLSSLGVTTVVEVADPAVAALVADRVAVVADARPVVAYPVLAPAPRHPGDVRVVAERVRARMGA
jgi:hypothetical protein